MSSEGRVEYTQGKGADWQLPVAAAVIAVAAVSLVSSMNPSGAVLPAQRGSAGLNEPGRLGQLQPTQPPLQPNAGSTQRSTSPTTSGSSLQSAGSAEALNQFEGGM